MWGTLRSVGQAGVDRAVFSLKLEEAGPGTQVQEQGGYRSLEGCCSQVDSSCAPSSSLAGIMIPVTSKESLVMPQGQRKGALHLQRGPHRAHPRVLPKHCSAAIRRAVLLPECFPYSCVSAAEAVSAHPVETLLDSREQCPRGHKMR